ncbi:MAG: hypothetical protein ACPGU7_03200 [Gammaproteobacteria bacterium]
MKTASYANDLDVTGTIHSAEINEVSAEVLRLLSLAYADGRFNALEDAFADFERLFTGRFPGFRACDTLYHDQQHTLDMTLAMARLLVAHDGQVKADQRLGTHRAELGLITALFHDSGYIRRTHDSAHGNGAEYTRVHVSRSADFLRAYLPTLGYGGDDVETAARMVHFTGYEMSLESIELACGKDRQLGYALGSADLMAQMADRCYLEKCRDRLYPEFVLGGIAAMKGPDGAPLYRSPTDLLEKTPGFAHGECARRLNGHFGSIHECVRTLFNGAHPYIDSIRANIEYVEKMVARGDFKNLRRQPPDTPGMERLAAFAPALLSTRVEAEDHRAHRR